MLNIMNIEFGKNNNNASQIKKIYNKGNIIITRPKTAKYPYKILSIKEFQKPISDDKIIIKRPKGNNIKTMNMKKSFSFVEDLQIDNYNKNKNKITKAFNQSYHDNNKNYILYTINKKKEYNEEDFVSKIFSADRGKAFLSSINNDSYNDFGQKKNRKFNIKRGFSSNSNNKKRVSSFSMSKYIEKYINNGHNNNKSININYSNSNNNNKNAYKINDDDNTQIIHFLSEIINTEKICKNLIYQTTNNIIKNYNKNKSKNNTRNLIIKRYYYNNNKNKISLSDAKNAYDKLKPVVINIKESFNISKINKNKNHYKNHDFFFRKKKFENTTKLNKNTDLKKSSLNSLNHKTESTEKNRALSVDIDKNFFKGKEKEKQKEKENSKNNTKDNKDNKDGTKKDFGFNQDKSKINNMKYKIKNRYKKKIKYNKDLKIKNKKKNNAFKSHDINNNGFLKYLNHLKNDRNYLGKSNNYRGIRYGKNCDIYDYLLIPKESEKIDEALNKDFTEFKSVNQ